MLIASFYDTAFAKQFAVRLRSTAEAFGIRCRIANRSELPGLDGKTGWKPEAVLATLDAYPDEDLLLVDPDSIVNRRPDILLDEKDFDVAVHYDVDTLAASGPLFLRNSERARRMAREWKDLARSTPEKSDFENLSRVLSHPVAPLDVRRLPVTYAWVERLHRARHPAARPVLTHFWTDGLITTRIKVAQ